MSDINDLWVELLFEAVDKLHAENSNWSLLSDRDRDLAALWKLEADMNNGGFVQFFCNWGVECYEISATALKKIGANKMLGIIESEFSIIESVYERSKDELEEYWDLARFITDDEGKELDRLDAEFWKRPEEIEVLGYKYYNA